MIYSRQLFWGSMTKCLLQGVARKLQCFDSKRRWIVAYSGGMDSHVLLHLIARICNSLPGSKPQILAFHVNHGLQANAAGWQVHCALQAEKLEIDFHSIDLSLGDMSQLSIETAAREGRYRAFAEFMEEGDVVLMAHHLDDQAETLMQRMLRGSGIAGLKSIPEQRALGKGHISRPLLSVSRSELLQYALSSGLQWVEDDSNSDQAHDRNYLRHSVMPRLEGRWPQYRQTLNRVVNHVNEASLLLDEVAAEDLAALSVSECSWGGYKICCQGLSLLSDSRQKNLIRYWLALCGFPLPSTLQMIELISFLSLPVDAKPLLQYAGIEVRRHQQFLVFMRALPPVDSNLKVTLGCGQAVQLEGVGELSLKLVDSSPSLAGFRVDEPLVIRLRQGGERCRPVGRDCSQSLKKLLQEYRVPPWWRDRLPLIYSGDHLVAVADLWVCEGFQSDQGYQLDWLKIDA